MTERIRVALLVGLALLIYLNSLFNRFTYDDYTYILHNPTVAEPSLRGLADPGNDPSHRFFRPVSFASYQLNWALAGDRPFGYHLTNVLLHAAVSLLLYFVLKKLLVAVPRGETIGWVAALLFAVHPIHVEAVASIVGRSELLAAGLLLVAWYSHLTDRPVLALTCFALALFAKESAVALVPLVVIGDYTGGRFKPLSRYLSIATTAVAFAAVLWAVQRGRFAERLVLFLNNPLAYLPADLRILNALRIAWKYLALQLYPARLSCDYSFSSIPLYATWKHLAPAAVATLVVFALWTWTLWTRRIEWCLPGAIYLAAFSVTANILLPIGTIMGERLAYLPSAGFCLLIAVAWIRVERVWSRAAWTALALVLLGFSARTVVRNRDWHDNFSLFSAAVRTVPGNAKMHDGLGGEYIMRGQRDAAQPELQAAIRIYPNFPQGNDASFRLVLLAADLEQTGDTDDALKFLDLAIHRSPGLSLAWSARSSVYLQRGQAALALRDAQIAWQVDPSNIQAQTVLKALGWTP